MSISVTVDPDDPTPPYEQLRRQLAGYIHSGELAAGRRLSSVRQLAAALGLANGTVARAYRELEAGGLVSTRRGGGTTVLERNAPDDPAPATSDQDSDGQGPERLAALASRFVTQARRLDPSDDEIIDAVGAALRG